MMKYNFKIVTTTFAKLSYIRSSSALWDIVMNRIIRSWWLKMPAATGVKHLLIDVRGILLMPRNVLCVHQARKIYFEKYRCRALQYSTKMMTIRRR
jgi:hypothetical protein